MPTEPQSRFLAWETIVPKPPTKAALKRELRDTLRRIVRGMSASTRYTRLKAAQQFAETHGLEFPEEYRRMLTLAAQEWLDAYMVEVRTADYPEFEEERLRIAQNRPAQPWIILMTQPDRDTYCGTCADEEVMNAV